ncbi:MAG: DMT family transporter [Caulobacteraceae bacterium]|nr:DMT family transporter [Caulobacteraceae bacterium]
MFPLLWIPATLFASGFQVARNALQRGLMPSAGPWGATLVRFLFGLPFSLVFVAIAFALTPAARLQFSAAFWSAAMTGALSQVLATAALLVAMRRAGFAVGTAMQQSSLPLAAVIGLVWFHDQLSALAWVGVVVATAGLAALTWPRHASGPQPVSGAAFGLASGLCFGFSLNAVRHAGLALEPHHPIVSALACVAIVQAAQALALTGVLALKDRGALKAVVAGWRGSLGAGLCGACASAGWFVALALSPAAPVRALGVIEAPIAAVAGRRLFSERLHGLQILAGCAVLAGVLLTTLT